MIKKTPQIVLISTFLVCGVFLFLLVPFSAFASTLADWYNLNDDSDGGAIYGAVWKAQTFTATSTGYELWSVKVKAYITGDPDNCILGIRPTDGTNPTSSQDIASTTLDTTSWSSSAPGDWYEFSFSDHPELTGSTKYALVFRCPDASGSPDLLRWRADFSSPTYGGGAFYTSSNSGSSWSVESGYDFMFETYASSTAEGESGTTTSATSTSVILNQDTYPLIFFFAILLFLLTFYIVLKA